MLKSPTWGTEHIEVDWIWGKWRKIYQDHFIYCIKKFRYLNKLTFYDIV